MPYCRACGVEVSPNTIYCPECGEELNFGSAELDETERPKEPTSEESETFESEPDPTSEPEPVSEPDSAIESESTVESGPEPAPIETKSTSESSSISIWSKLGAVVCVPLALAGLFLELASVYTLVIGEYTLGEFAIVSVLFGLLAFIPLAYIYRIYTRINMSLTEIV